MQPPLPEGSEAGILKGMYLLREGPGGERPRVQLMGSGTILREAIEAADLLENDFGIESDLWSVTSFGELRREGLEVERWNTLHPDAAPRRSYLEGALAERAGPVIAATDYVRAHADQIRAFVPGPYRVLGTDGFGRSDTRARLRHFFEVNRYFIAIAAVHSLAQEGAVPAAMVQRAIEKYGIDPEKPNPVTN